MLFYRFSSRCRVLCAVLFGISSACIPLQADETRAATTPQFKPLSGTKILLAGAPLAIDLSTAIFPTLNKPIAKTPIAAAPKVKTSLSFTPLRVGETRRVSLLLDEATVSHWTTRQKLDQVRDWLLFTAICASGLPADAINQATFDLPPTRHGFVQPVGNFEYGKTRSCALGKGQAVALVPNDETERRNQYLASIADNYRKNTGTIPSTIQVFAYDINLNTASATLKRNADVNGSALYSAGVGYHESNITSAAELEDFLKKTNDLTFAELRSGKLYVGGRAISDQPFTTPEMVATLWKSERKIRDWRGVYAQRDAIVVGGKEWVAQRKQLIAGLEKALSQRADSHNQAVRNFETQRNTYNDRVIAYNKRVIGFNALPAGSRSASEGRSIQEAKTRLDVLKNRLNTEDKRLEQAKSKLKTEEAIIEKSHSDFTSERTGSKQIDLSNAKFRKLIALTRDFEKELKKIKLETKNASAALGTGFSLDPTFDYASMLQRLPEIRQWFTDAVSGHPLLTKNLKADIAEIEAGFKDKDDLQLYRFLRKLEAHGKSDEANGLLSLLHEEFGLQAARYDGTLRGTEVGMVLFYTDLLAKLWAIDYQKASPHHEVAAFQNDFAPLPAVRLSSIYKKDIEQHGDTRLWFGKSDKGFAISQEGRRLCMAHNATRVFAASANSLNPDAEGAPNARSAAFLGWWNDHYEEIANFEPQYERLNQIMKWSLAITWLESQGQGDRLKFLGNVPVNTSYWFSDWAKQQPNLRFTEWQKIGFLKRNERKIETEALPLLKSAPFVSFGQVTSLSGGVSLASVDVFKGRAPQTKLPHLSETIQRAEVKSYRQTKPNQSALSNHDGTVYTLDQSTNRLPVVTAHPAPQSPQRADFVQIPPRPVERELASQTKRLDMNVKVGPEPFKTTCIRETKGAFQVGQRGRDLDIAQQVSREISANMVKPNGAPYSNDTIVAALLSHPQVKAVAQSATPNEFGFQLNNGKNWHRITLSRGGMSPPPPPGKGDVPIAAPPPPPGKGGFPSGPTGDQPEPLHIWLGIYDQPTKKRAISATSYIRVGEVSNQEAGFKTLIVPRGPPKGTKVNLTIDGHSFKGLADPQTGDVYFQLAGLPRPIQDEPTNFSRYFTSALNQELQTQLKRNPAEVRLVAKAQQSALPSQLARVDTLLEQGNFTDAIYLLDDIETQYASQPAALNQLLVRKVSAHLGRNNLPDTAQTLGIPETTNYSTLLDEVEARMHSSQVQATKQDWQRVKVFAETRQNLSQSTTGKVVPGFKNKTAQANYCLGQSTEYLPVRTVAEMPANAPLYLEAPVHRLLRRNPNLAQRTVIQQLVTSGHVEVFKIKNADIARFRFQQLYINGQPFPLQKVDSLREAMWMDGLVQLHNVADETNGTDHGEWIYLVVVRRK